MATAPMVSVIIPAYNASRWLPDAIGSVRVQDIPNAEIIVVNDGSTDDIDSILQSLAGDDLVVHTQANRGLGAARNAGLARARGEFIKFLDADDLLLPNALNHQIKWLKDHPEVGAVSGNSYRCDPAKTIYRKISYKSGLVPLEQIVVSNPFPIHAILFRRDAIHKLTFDETLKAAEDWDFISRMMLGQTKFHHTQLNACLYRTFPQSMSSDADKQGSALLEVIEKIYANSELPNFLLPKNPSAIANACSHAIAKACTTGDIECARRWMGRFSEIENGPKSWRKLIPRVVAAERNPRSISRDKFMETFLGIVNPADVIAARKSVSVALHRDDFARAREFGTSAEAVSAGITMIRGMTGRRG